MTARERVKGIRGGGMNIYRVVVWIVRYGATALGHALTRGGTVTW